MIILADKNIPTEALSSLYTYGEVVRIQTDRITYDAISGHPDIFICELDNTWVIAPNLPDKYKAQLKKLQIPFVEGMEELGTKHPETAKYNGVVTNDYFIGNTEYIDKKVLELISRLP